MRDEQFKTAYKKLTAKLDMYFHTCLRKSGFPLPYEELKRTLRSITMTDAFLNSRKESLSGYDIEALIWLKARNTWFEFIKLPNHEELKVLDENASNEPDPFHQLYVRDQLQKIKDQVDPETWEIIEMRAGGLSYKEIAKTLHETEGKIKMQMSRLREKLKEQALGL